MNCQRLVPKPEWKVDCSSSRIKLCGCVICRKSAMFTLIVKLAVIIGVMQHHCQVQLLVDFFHMDADVQCCDKNASKSNTPKKKAGHFLDRSHFHTKMSGSLSMEQLFIRKLQQVVCSPHCIASSQKSSNGWSSSQLKLWHKASKQSHFLNTFCLFQTMKWATSWNMKLDEMWLSHHSPILHDVGEFKISFTLEDFRWIYRASY